MPLRPNPGRCPPEAQGRRVRCVLRDGFDTRAAEPGGWPADGRGGVNWALTGSPFDITQWELAA